MPLVWCSGQGLLPLVWCCGLGLRRWHGVDNIFKNGDDTAVLGTKKVQSKYKLYSVMVYKSVPNVYNRVPSVYPLITLITKTQRCRYGRPIQRGSNDY